MSRGHSADTSGNRQCRVRPPRIRRVIYSIYGIEQSSNAGHNIVVIHALPAITLNHAHASPR
jgi:hypothetical protein